MYLFVFPTSVRVYLLNVFVRSCTINAHVNSFHIQFHQVFANISSNMYYSSHSGGDAIPNVNFRVSRHPLLISSPLKLSLLLTCVCFSMSVVFYPYLLIA